MGLHDTISRLRDAKQASASAEDALPSRISAWDKAIRELYHLIVMSYLGDLVATGEIRTEIKPIRSDRTAWGFYDTASLTLDIHGTIVELKPFDAMWPGEVQTVFMQRRGRGEQVKFKLGSDGRWTVTLHPADEFDARMNGREPSWNYRPLTDVTFGEALDSLLTAGRS